MREFIISTESNNDLSPEFIAANNINVVPHYYNVEEAMYGEPGNTLTNKQFYDEMRAGKKVGTAASNPGVILDQFTEFAKQGKDILHISFSSALSGGYQNIVNGANEVMEEYPDCKIIVVDTLSASLGEGLLIQYALNLKAEGKDITETAEAVKAMVPNVSVQFTVENLEYLYRGGRLSRTSAVVGSMLNLKPILHINEEGKLVAYAKVIGRKKSFATMLDHMEHSLGSFRDKQIFIGIVHGDCEEEAKQLRDMIQKRFGYENYMIEPIGPSVGAHSGPGTLGIIFLGDQK